jgi:hypothetical protein
MRCRTGSCRVHRMRSESEKASPLDIFGGRGCGKLRLHACKSGLNGLPV